MDRFKKYWFLVKMLAQMIRFRLRVAWFKITKH